MNKYLFLIFLFLYLGCTYDNEEDYYDNGDFNCDWKNTNFNLFLPDENCVLENLSFESHISNIIDIKCVSCHDKNNSQGINLTSYSELLSYDFCFQIDNELMPPLNLPQIFQLTDCEKLQIKTWIDNGLVE